MAVDPSYLHTDGTANVVSVVVSNKVEGAGATAVFDGRSYYQSLVTISQTASLNNTLDYAFAVGNAGIGNASSSYLTSRTVDMGGLGSSSISSAELHAIYTYGSGGLDDAVLLNGTSLLGNDVANGNNGDTNNYPADIVATSAITNDLNATDNVLKFTADAADLPSARRWRIMFFLKWRLLESSMRCRSQARWRFWHPLRPPRCLSS